MRRARRSKIVRAVDYWTVGEAEQLRVCNLLGELQQATIEMSARVAIGRRRPLSSGSSHINQHHQQISSFKFLRNA